MKTFYVVTAVMPWSSLRIEVSGLTIRLDDGETAGYMPVFVTREAAEACIQRGVDAGAPVGRAGVLVFNDGCTEPPPPPAGGQEDGQS